MSRPTLALAALLLSLLALLLPHLAAAAASAGPDTLTFSIDPATPTSAPINPNLVSFSIEVWDLTRWTDRYPAPPRPAWLALMRQLMLTPDQQGPRYRIGGDSADSCVYGHPYPLPRPPSGPPLSYSINATDLLTWNQAMAALKTTMTLDLNFRRGDNATWAVEYVQAIDHVIGWGRVQALEVGNEVDLYGGGERFRPKGYNYTDYKQEYTLYVQAIQAAVPNLPKRIFQGLVNIGWDWLANNLDDYLSSPVIEQSLYSISQHDYPIPSCIGNNVTIEDILNDAYSSSTSEFLAQHGTVEKLHKHNISFLAGEGSDAVCNGQGPMVLNTFSTALWVVDQLMQAARSGVEYYYFHSWSTGTDTFSVIVYGNRVAPDRFLVQPIYYGLRLFNMATSHHARTVKLTASTSTNRHVHAYAALAASIARLSIVVVHKDLHTTAPTNVTFGLPLAAAANATLVRLVAPSVDSEYGVTLAGQTYDDSKDGMPLGRWVEEAVVGRADGKGMVWYAFVVQPLSAVLVQLAGVQADVLSEVRME